MQAAETSSIELGELTIEITRKKIKNIHLSVYPPDGQIRIAAPLRTHNDVLRVFAIARLPWIRQQRIKYVGQERQPPRRYVSGESHYVQGRRYRLLVIHGDKRSVELKRHLILHLPEKSTQGERQVVLREWYRSLLKEQIPPLLQKWCAVMNLEPPEWGVKVMRTKWGSCNAAARRIWLNLELAKKSPRCLEYVLVHELVHLIERHHNDNFKQLLNYHMPDWMAVRQELNQAPLAHVERI